MTREDDFLQAVSQQIRAETSAAGLSAAKVARSIGMDRTTLHRYYNGERDIPLSALFRIAEGIGIDPAIILDRAEQRAGGDAEEGGDTS